MLEAMVPLMPMPVRSMDTYEDGSASIKATV